MKKKLPISEKSLIRISVILVVFIAGVLFKGTSAQAQIYEPEGLNMPGAWNSWTNPPTNNLALASYTEVPGGRVVKFATGIQRWQTIFSVAASGGDVVGGSYEWLFTSGPTGNPWGNKWANVSVAMNTLQLYTKEGGSNNTITVTNGKWYCMNWEDAGYVDTRAIFMETSAQPVTIATVSVPAVVDPGNPVAITLTMSQLPAPEELFYLRYSTDGWASSVPVTVAMTGISGTAQIPGLSEGTVVSYYAFSSTVSDLNSDYDLFTIRMNTNGGINYTYTVTTPTPVITFANLQNPPAGTIDLGSAYTVTGAALIPGVTGQPTPAAGLEAWVGYSSSNADPATWGSWIAATYTGPLSGNDEFSANLGAVVNSAGTWYYATRFRLNGGSYVYGGYSSTGGGFWDGIYNVAGVLTVNEPTVPMVLTLQNVTVASEQNFCYNAKNTITVAGNGTYFDVLSGATVAMIAGQNIIFLPGTIVQNGGYLKGSITSNGSFCTASPVPSVKDAATTGVPPVESGGYAFSIFPNPATSEVTVDLHGVADKAQSLLELFSVQGSRVYTQTITGSGKFSFSVTGIQAGVYCLRIVSGDKVQTRMMVKQ